MCPRGHDKTEVGIDKQGQCSQCRRDQNRDRARARRRRQGRPEIKAGMCRNGTHLKPGPGPCKPCLAENRKRYLKNRADRGMAPPPSRDVYAQEPDGWEDEFGPVPNRVKDSEWYDPVIVRRALLGYPTGRIPHKLEWIEIVNRMPSDMHASTVAGWCGVSTETVCDWARNFREKEVAA